MPVVTTCGFFPSREIAGIDWISCSSTKVFTIYLLIIGPLPATVYIIPMGRGTYRITLIFARTFTTSGFGKSE